MVFSQLPPSFIMTAIDDRRGYPWKMALSGYAAFRVPG
jgi:hypothetical protein